MTNINTPILNLPSALSLDGSEKFPLVQGATTKQAATGLLVTFSQTGGVQSANLVFAGPTSGAAAAPSFRSLVTADLSGVTLPAANGGTGIASYAIGDLIYASGATTLSKLADVATGNALISGGVATAPSWGKIGLTTHVSGILPVANGGTGVSSLGTLTKADDTNVTLTLGGTPANSLIQSVSITAGWSGQLSIARGGTGQATAAAAFDALAPTTTRGDLIARGASSNGRLAIGTSGYLLGSNGTDPSWVGFAATGTGSTTRTWASKIQEIAVSIVDKGADSTGATDCSTAFNNAVQALPSTGGVILLPSGTFLFTTAPTALDRPVWVLGQGRASTKIILGADITLFDATSGSSSQSMFDGFSVYSKYSNVTISIASPGVVTWSSHGLSAGQPFWFETTSALPTGITAGNTYYVLAAGITSNSFRFSATSGGAAVNTSGTQSGTQTVYTWRTAGSVISIGTIRQYVRDLYMWGVYKGVSYSSNAYITWTNDVEIRNTTPNAASANGAGFYVTATNAAAPDTLWWNDCIVQSNWPASKGRSAWTFESGVTLILKGCTGASTDFGCLIGPTGSSGVLFPTFSQCFFDSTGTAGLYISGNNTASVVGLKASQTWFSQSSGNGVTIAQFGTATLDGFEFNECYIHKNVSGLDVTATAVNVAVNGGTFAQNTTAINIAANTNKFSIIGARIGPVDGYTANTNGIVIAAGTSDEYVIAGNDLTGNGTAYANGASGTNRKIYGNLGISVEDFGTTDALTIGTIELGAVSDTTLSRASAGRLAVEGVNVVTVSSTDTLTNKTLTSPSIGTALNMASGIAINWNSGTYTLTQTGAVLAGSGALTAAELRATSDVSGASGATSLTNTADLSANSTGVGTIKFKGATSRDTTGFIKFYINTTAYYVPVFSAITS